MGRNGDRKRLCLGNGHMLWYALSCTLETYTPINSVKTTKKLQQISYSIVMHVFLLKFSNKIRLTVFTGFNMVVEAVSNATDKEE